jgi:hypothetical protein
MKKVLLFFLSFIQFNTFAQTTFKIKGTIYNAKDREIQLMGFEGTKDLLLFKTKTDSLGNFIINYPKNYIGAASLQVKELTNLIVLLNQEVDLFYLPRINTVSGITNEHITKWGWKVNEKGWVNFPDYQGRVYRKKMSWYGRVHEKIIGGTRFSVLPTNDELYFIEHHKTIQKQEKQNNFYTTI